MGVGAVGVGAVGVGAVGVGAAGVGAAGVGAAGGRGCRGQGLQGRRVGGSRAGGSTRCTVRGDRTWGRIQGRCGRACESGGRNPGACRGPAPGEEMREGRGRVSDECWVSETGTERDGEGFRTGAGKHLDNRGENPGAARWALHQVRSEGGR